MPRCNAHPPSGEAVEGNLAIAIVKPAEFFVGNGPPKRRQLTSNSVGINAEFNELRHVGVKILVKNANRLGHVRFQIRLRAAAHVLHFRQDPVDQVNRDRSFADC